MPLILGACAGTPPAPKAADLPDDFALGVTVLPRAGENTPQAAWYIIEPDDVLHAAIGERLPSSPAPPAVRTLSREQVRHVWELVVAGGLADTSWPAIADGSTRATNSAAIVYVAAAGRRRTFALPADRAGDLSPVISELDRLGWVPTPGPNLTP